MLTAKESVQIQGIMSILLDRDIVTTKELASMIELSEKTVRLRLDHIDTYFRQNKFGSIQRKTRVGVWLEIEPGAEASVQAMARRTETNDVYTGEDRLTQIISVFLMNPETVFTLTGLSQELFLSVPTVSKLIDEAQTWFQQYNITLEKQTNRGHWIEFEEVNYRIAFKSFLVTNAKTSHVEEYLSRYIQGVNIDALSTIIHDTEKMWDIRLTDETFVSIMALLGLMIVRVSNHHGLNYQINPAMFNKQDYDFVVAIFKQVLEPLNLPIIPDEVDMVGMEVFFNSSFSLGINHADEPNDKLEGVVDRMIETISDILDADLRNDHLLRQGLLLHLRPAIFRMEFNYRMDTMQFHDVRQAYKRIYRAVWSTSIILEETYQIQTNETELAYIALYIQAAIERLENPFKIVLVSSKTNAQNSLIMENLRKRVLGELPDAVISKHAFSAKILSEYDIIIATDQLDGYTDPKIIAISPFVTNLDVRNLNHHINMRLVAKGETNKRFDNRCRQLFHPELVYHKKESTTKEEIITEITQLMIDRGFVRENYTISVLQREQNSHTTIGNGVAIPHGNQDEVIKPCVGVIVLDKPVKWTAEESVSLIFLLAMRMKTPEEAEVTKLFYKEYINLVADDFRLEQIIKSKSDRELFDYMVS